MEMTSQSNDSPPPSLWKQRKELNQHRKILLEKIKFLESLERPSPSQPSEPSPPSTEKRTGFFQRATALFSSEPSLPPSPESEQKLLEEDLGDYATDAGKYGRKLHEQLSVLCGSIDPSSRTHLQATNTLNNLHAQITSTDIQQIIAANTKLFQEQITNKGKDYTSCALATIDLFTTIQETSEMAHQYIQRWRLSSARPTSFSR